jgi:hypothetical protein
LVENPNLTSPRGIGKVGTVTVSTS